MLKWLLLLAAIGGAIYWFRFSPMVVQEHTVGRGKMFEEVLAQARRQHQRVQQLIASNSQTEADMDKAIESLAIAEAGLARAEAAIAEGETQVIAAEKTLAYHRARLDDTQISAPFAGLIVRRMLDPGDVAVPGSPMLTLVSLEELWISAWVAGRPIAQNHYEMIVDTTYEMEDGVFRRSS